MVKLDKGYVLDGPDGPVALAARFRDRPQPVVQHIMFGPDYDAAATRPPPAQQRSGR